MESDRNLTSACLVLFFYSCSWAFAHPQMCRKDKKERIKQIKFVFWWFMMTEILCLVCHIILHALLAKKKAQYARQSLSPSVINADAWLALQSSTTTLHFHISFSYIMILLYKFLVMLCYVGKFTNKIGTCEMCGSRHPLYRWIVILTSTNECDVFWCWTIFAHVLVGENKSRISMKILYVKI